MDEGLRQAVSSIDLEASRCLGVDERSRLLLEVQLLIIVLLGSVFVNDDDLIIGVYVKGVNSLRARIQQLENEATKGKKSHEDAATWEGTLKKEVEAVVGFRDKLADVEKGLEDAQKETKVLGTWDIKTTICLRKSLESVVKEYGTTATLKKKLSVVKKDLSKVRL
jgi:hypothetical protein